MNKQCELCSRATRFEWATHCPQCWFGVVKRGEAREGHVDQFPHAVEVTPEEIDKLLLSKSFVDLVKNISENSTSPDPRFIDLIDENFEKYLM